MWLLEGVRCTPIRKIKVVVDITDPLTPVLTLEAFMKTFGGKPDPQRYRIVEIEVLSCPEDQSVVLPSECAECPRFIKRVRDSIYCANRPVS